MPSMEETLLAYNAKRAAKEAAIREQAAANQAPAKLQTCQQCHAPCTGSVQVLGAAMCDPCFDRRIHQQTREGKS